MLTDKPIEPSIFHQEPYVVNDHVEQFQRFLVCLKFVKFPVAHRAFLSGTSQREKSVASGQWQVLRGRIDSLPLAAIHLPLLLLLSLPLVPRYLFLFFFVSSHFFAIYSLPFILCHTPLFTCHFFVLCHLPLATSHSSLFFASRQIKIKRNPFIGVVFSPDVAAV